VSVRALGTPRVVKCDSSARGGAEPYARACGFRKFWPVPYTPAEYDESLLRWIYVAYYLKIAAVFVAYVVLGVAVPSKLGSGGAVPPPTP
jgi:hypothetical protein